VNKKGKSRGREQGAERQQMLPLRGWHAQHGGTTVAISEPAFVEEHMKAERAALDACAARSHMTATRC
jgi:hypothetical protein